MGYFLPPLPGLGQPGPENQIEKENFDANQKSKSGADRCAPAEFL